MNIEIKLADPLVIWSHIEIKLADPVVTRYSEVLTQYDDSNGSGFSATVFRDASDLTGITNNQRAA